MIKHAITELNGGTTITVNESVEGEFIEQKIERITTRNEPITDGAPIIYTERKDGVRPEYNIRTDTKELALEAIDIRNKMHLAKREDGIKAREPKTEGQPIQGTGDGNTAA